MKDDHPGTVTRYALYLSVVSICIAVASCRSPISVRSYSGPGLPNGNVAFLKERLPVILVSVDGQAVGLKTLYRNIHISPLVIELLPGHHTISVSYYQEGPFCTLRSLQPVTLDLRAEAGHTYMVSWLTSPPFCADGQWVPSITDITNE